MRTFLLDLKHAWRGFRAAPGPAAVIVLTLALGVGANTAVFSVFHAMLLEPLPYRDAGRLAFIWLHFGEAEYARGPMSGPDLKDLREGAGTFEALGAIWASGTVALGGEGLDPEELRGAVVTTNFFDVLGASPALGRTFREEDGREGAPASVLLGWDLFQRRFGGDRTIVGRPIILDDEPAVVVGVMPASFRLLLPPDSAVPDRLQIFRPLWPGFEYGPRGNLFLRVVGRMRPGVTIEQARADVDNVARRIPVELGTPRAFRTVALQQDGVREIEGPLAALFAGVGILLLIACVNVAGLLVARAAARARDTAIRRALGATRARLVSQALAEGVLVTAAGALAGLVAGYAGLRLLIALAPPELTRIEAARVDADVLLFTLGSAVVWGLLLSVMPAAELFKADPQRALVVERRTGGQSTRHRTRAALVTIQVAMSAVLLVGAGLLVRAFVELQRVDTGFAFHRHFTFRVSLPWSRYPSSDALGAASTELRARLAGIPGVTGVGAISHLPFDQLPNWALTYARDAGSTGGGAARADTRSVTPGLVEVMGIAPIEGRLFDGTERPDHPVVVIDDLLARRLWPGESAIGRSFLLGQAMPDQAATVIGVVRHTRIRSLVADLSPQIYVPYSTLPRSPMAYILKSDRDPSLVAADVRRVVAGFDSRLAVFDERPLADYVENARSIQRFTMRLAGVFALAALLLAGIGIYSVLAYAVVTRRHELGVRRALGAGAAHLVRDVMGEGLTFATVGAAVGLFAAALGGGLLESQLYGVHPRDPLTFAATALVILAGAVLACAVPTWRALSVSPLEALRE